MFLAKVTSKSRVYVSLASAGPLKPSEWHTCSQDCPGSKRMLLLCANAPRPQPVRPLSRTTRPRGALLCLNRSQVRSSPTAEAVRLRPPEIRLPACPPKRTKHDAVVVLLAQTARVPPPPPLMHFVDKLFSSAPQQDLRLLRQTRHVRNARRPAARAPAHEALLRLPMERACRCSTPGPSCLCAFLDRDRDGRRVLLIRIVLLGAASFFIFLQSLSWPPDSQCCFWQAGAAVARAAAAAFLAQ